MQRFAYERPGTLGEAIGLLVAHRRGGRPLAGGTDLIIRLRDRTISAAVVVDVKRVPELAPGIRHEGDRLVIGAGTVMTDIAEDATIRTRFAALAEAALVVGSVQIRNRATLAGNICNASPAADTAPALLVYGADVVVAGPGGTRRIPIDDWFVRSGVTTLREGELVTAIELPLVDGPVGATTSGGPGGAATTWHRSRSPARCGARARHAGLRECRAAAVARDDESGTLADPDSSAEARLAVWTACSPLPHRRRPRCGPAPSTASRCSASSGCERSRPRTGASPSPPRDRRRRRDPARRQRARARSTSNPITRCSTCSARTSA